MRVQVKVNIEGINSLMTKEISPYLCLCLGSPLCLSLLGNTKLFGLGFLCNDFMKCV